MSKLGMIALILAIAISAIAAEQLAGPSAEIASTALVSISPEALMRTVGPLPETEVASFY
jgi:hypothetical protein